MLMPKKQKFRKRFRGKIRGKAQRGSTVAFGDYGLKALESGLLTSRQIEAGRRTITHATKRAGKVWIRVFPDKPITKKPQEVRMGSGKGAVDHYSAVIRRGRIIYEIAGVSREVAEEALLLAARKLPFKSKIVAREEKGE